MPISSNFPNQKRISKALIRNVHIQTYVCIYLFFFFGEFLLLKRTPLFPMESSWSQTSWLPRSRVRKFSSSVLHTTPIHSITKDTVSKCGLARPQSIDWPNGSVGSSFKAQDAWVWLPLEIFSFAQGSSGNLPLPIACCAFQQIFKEHWWLGQTPPRFREIYSLFSLILFHGLSPPWASCGLSTSQVLFSKMWLGFEIIIQACFGPTLFIAASLQ